MSDKIIEVKQIKKYYSSGFYQRSYIRAVDGVSFDIKKGETLALIGESGCGKSTLGKCMLRLVEPTAGRIYFDGVNILELNQAELRTCRPRMQMIFQDADGSLNPRMKVSTLLFEPFKIQDMAANPARERVAHLMEMVKLTPELLNRHPHELSGGQRQRVGIARAIALNPQLIVADEPATSLDILVQMQILQLMKRLQAEFNISYLFISHDLKTVKFISDRICVMYSGKLVEIARPDQLFKRAVHPYTQLLLSVLIPDISPPNSKQGRPLNDHFDQSQPVSQRIYGCGYYSRCPQKRSICSEISPKLQKIDADHFAACHFPS